MPTVPVTRLSRETYEEKPAKSVPSVPVSAPSEESVRRELATAVRQELLRQGTVSTDFLDRFAASHWTAEQANTPAGWDYAALRRAARYEEGTAHQREQYERIKQEGEWMSQVGAVIPDSAALQTYLSLQIPAYQAQWEQAGLSSREAAQQVAQFHHQTVEKHLSRSLASGDWQTAHQVLAQQGGALPEERRAEYARQVRSVFAREEGRRIWRETLLHTSDTQQARTRALEQLAEPDDQLRSQIQEEIEHLAVERVHTLAVRGADMCSRLAQAVDVNQAEQWLYTQDIWQGNVLESARQAVGKLDNAASAAQQVWFVKNYFNPSADAEQALAQGRCCGRDYFRLKAVIYRRQSGQNTSREEWLLKGISRWMRQQGFTDKDLSQASYAVLCGGGEEEQARIWQKIKTLLTC